MTDEQLLDEICWAIVNIQPDYGRLQFNDAQPIARAVLAVIKAELTRLRAELWDQNHGPAMNIQGTAPMTDEQLVEAMARAMCGKFAGPLCQRQCPQCEDCSRAALAVVKPELDRLRRDLMTMLDREAGTIKRHDAKFDALETERDRLREENYALKLAAAGGEDAPGSAAMVTPAMVERWQKENEAEISRLREALRLARNRLQHLALEGGYGMKRRLETAEWAEEATAALEGRADE